MSRASIGVVLIAVVGVLSPSAVRADDSAVEAKRAAEVRKKLAATIDFGGMDDSASLQDGLEYLHRISGIAFEVNEPAFKDEMIDDVTSKALGREIPRMKEVSAETALRRVLARIPTPSGTTFVVRGGVVEITTRRAASPFSWNEAPQVSVAFDKRELKEALQEIADATGVNVVLDARAADKGKTPVSATMRAVAVAPAVQLLANMADLTIMSLPLENVLYVTTRENAKSLRAELLQLGKLDLDDPTPANGEASSQKETERLLKERDEEIRRLKEKLKRKKQPEPEPKKDK